MRHKKIHSFLILLAMILLITTVAYAADPLMITTTSFPNGKLGQPYSVQLNATGGEGGYTYSIYRGTLPRGLSLSPDGVISGIPEVGGLFGNVTFRVTDSANKTHNKKVIIRIMSKTVNFAVSNNYYEYDGQPHTAVCVSDSDEIVPEDYTVTYGGQEEQTNVGAYVIDIEGPGLLAKSYRVGSITPRQLLIVANSSSAIRLSSMSVEYDGEPHALTPVVEPAEIQNDYVLSYSGRGDTEYGPSVEPPSAVGTYTVTATTTNPNYVTRTATASLNINAPRVNFTVSNVNVTYNGLPQQAEIVPDTEYSGNYTVTYDDMSTGEVETLESVTEAGQYRINIALDDPNKQVGDITFDSIIVNPRDINFAVSENDIQYQPGVKQYEAQITPSIEGFADYTVTYDDAATEDVENLPYVSEAGTYEINVELDDTTNANTSRNNRVGSITPKTFNVGKVRVSFEVSNNSVDYDPSPERDGYRADVTPSINGFTDYKVVYVDAENGRHEDKVPDVGTYTIDIEFTGDEAQNYELGNITPNTFTVNPLTVDFDVERVSVDYEPANTEGYSANVTPGISGFEDFIVTYMAEDGTEFLDKVDSVGEYEIRIELTAAAGNHYQMGTVSADRFKVNPYTVNFAVTDSELTYEPEKQRYEVRVVADNLADFHDFQVIYVDANGVEHNDYVEAVGEYNIQITLTGENAGNYAVGTITPNKFKVNKKVVNFFVSGETVEYSPDTNEYRATVEPDVEGFTDFTVSYVKDNVPYESVTAIGTYDIDIQIGENAAENYEKGTVSTDKFVLNPCTVNFIVTDNIVNFDPETKDYRAAIAPDVENFTDYTVTYVKDGTEHKDKVNDAGVYDIRIELTDAAADNYSKGNVSADTFTVNPCAVNFTVSKNVVEYNPDKTSYAAVINPSIDGFTDYTVTYAKGEDTYENEIPLSGMKVLGEYAINITVDNVNYMLGEVTGGNTFTVNGPRAQLVLSNGNSPAAMIGDDEAAQAAFKENHVYNGVTYNPAAWGEGNNLDEDKTAYFIIDGNVNLTDLDCYATYSDGREVSAENITITVDEEDIATWLTKSHANGIYEMTYSFTDSGESAEIITAKRQLVMLNHMGDINSDRNVNAGDARYLQALVLTDLESQNPLYLYRVCDVNHDGDANEADAEAIMNRMNEPLINYYPLAK